MPGALGGGGGSPSPQVSYGSPGGTASIYQPHAQPAADTAYQNLLTTIYNNSANGLNALGGSSGQSPAGQYYPAAEQAANTYINNPYADSMMAAIQAIAPVFQQAGGQQQGYGNEVAGFAGQAAGMAPQVWGAAQSLPGYINQIASSAFDPQQELYNQTLGRVQDQATAGLANSGLLGTPYGAGLQDDALSNFNLGWQSQQLGRQTQGLGAIGAGLGAYGGAATTAGNLLGQGANLFGAASGLQNTGLAQQLQGIGLPYQTSIGQAGNQFTGIGNAINVGNQIYTPAQQSLNDLQSYLQLGQAASGIGGQFAGLANQQQLAGLGGLGTLAGASGIFGGYPGFLGSYGGGAGLANFAGTGLSAGDVSAVAADPSLSLAAYSAANTGGGTGLLGLLGGLLPF